MKTSYLFTLIAAAITAQMSLANDSQNPCEGIVLQGKYNFTEIVYEIDDRTHEEFLGTVLAKTDADGKIELSTFLKNGTPAGRYSAVLKTNEDNNCVLVSNRIDQFEETDAVVIRKSDDGVKGKLVVVDEETDFMVTLTPVQE